MNPVQMILRIPRTIGIGFIKVYRATLSPLIGAYVDIALFDVDNNDLSGTVPASLGNWRKIERFAVDENRFSGVLPAMSFSTMNDCYLLHDPAMDSFACPWPAGAKEVCFKDGSSGWVPITNDDCHGTAPPTPISRRSGDDLSG